MDSSGRPTDFTSPTGLQKSDWTPIRLRRTSGVVRTSDTIHELILTILGLKSLFEVRVGLPRVWFEFDRVQSDFGET